MTNGFIDATILSDILFALDRADRRHGPLGSNMAGLGVITEEYHEVVEAFRSGEAHRMRAELVDLTTGCLRCLLAIDSGEWK